MSCDYTLDMYTVVKLDSISLNRFLDEIKRKLSRQVMSLQVKDTLTCLHTNFGSMTVKWSIKCYKFCDL